MSVTFLVALVVALLAIVYWRIVLMIVVAILIAMVATGINTVSGAVSALHEHQTIVAPGVPGAQTLQVRRPASGRAIPATRAAALRSRIPELRGSPPDEPTVVGQPSGAQNVNAERPVETPGRAVPRASAR